MYRTYQNAKKERKDGERKINEIDVKLDLETPEPGIHKILSAIRPSWKVEDAIIKPMTDGHLNFMWKVTLEDQPDDKIIFRMFDAAKAYLDHETEYKVLQALNKEGVIVPMYCRFKNGFAYKYDEGNTLQPKQMTDPHIYKKIIAKMHAFHSIDVDTLNVVPKVLLRDILPIVMGAFGSPMVEPLDSLDIFTDNFPSRKDILAEMQWGIDTVYSQLLEDFPTVLLHNDPHHLNIIYNKERDTIQLIDFDLIGIGPEVYDIGIHLERDMQFKIEDAGLDLVGDEEFKRQWMTAYLETHPKYKGQAGSTDFVDKWLDGVNRSFYLSSVMVLIFSLLQAVTTPPGEFDFWRLAKTLLTRTKKTKAMFSDEPVRGVKL